MAQTAFPSSQKVVLGSVTLDEEMKTEDRSIDRSDSKEKYDEEREKYGEVRRKMVCRPKERG